MKSLPERIMGYAETKPDATPVQAEDLLHFGDRADVSRALSRLTRSERLMRIYRGNYMRPIQTRFGLRAPSLDKALVSLSELWGEVVVPNGGWQRRTRLPGWSSIEWSGPREVEKSLDAALPALSQEDLNELSAAQAIMPGWMLERLSVRLVHG